MEDYKRDVGRRLRAVRHMQGLTLAEVEARSDGEWKAVVVGSYERGDRGISVPRLSALASFYSVPVSHLLPTDGGSRDTQQGATIDLGALAGDTGRFVTLVRFVERIKQERGDYNGRVLTLRAEDVRTVAAATGVDPDGYVEELERAGLIIGDDADEGAPADAEVPAGVGQQRNGAAVLQRARPVTPAQPRATVP